MFVTCTAVFDARNRFKLPRFRTLSWQSSAKSKRTQPSFAMRPWLQSFQEWLDLSASAARVNPSLDQSGRCGRRVFPQRSKYPACLFPASLNMLAVFGIIYVRKYVVGEVELLQGPIDQPSQISFRSRKCQLGSKCRGNSPDGPPVRSIPVAQLAHVIGFCRVSLQPLT
jgi:hypothetical protein